MPGPRIHGRQHARVFEPGLREVIRAYRRRDRGHEGPHGEAGCRARTDSPSTVVSLLKTPFVWQGLSTASLPVPCVRRAMSRVRSAQLDWDAAPGWTAASAALLSHKGCCLLPPYGSPDRSSMRSLDVIRTSQSLRPSSSLSSHWPVRSAQPRRLDPHQSGRIGARAEAYYRPPAPIESAGNLAQERRDLVTMFALLFSFGPWMPLALAAGHSSCPPGGSALLVGTQRSCKPRQSRALLPGFCSRDCA